MSLEHRIDNVKRIGLLKKKIQQKGFVRIIETHNAISGLIANDSTVVLDTGEQREFDGFWESSLTDSASKGFPDIELVSLDSRLETISQILVVTDKPMIVDGDTGGDFNQFEYMVKKLERAGVSMVIIEDKVFPKRNSLEAGTRQTLEKPEVFAEKIRRGIEIKSDPDFLVVARIESLIAGFGLQDAIERAELYLKDADPSQIIEFAKKFKSFPPELIKEKLLICVPTTYNSLTCSQLAGYGFNIIIHANHNLRAAYKAMEDVCKQILTYDRTAEADEICTPIKSIFAKVGFLSVKEKDKQAAQKLKSKLKVVIPSAGVNELTRQLGKPIALVEINNKKLIERQLENFYNCGLDNIVLIRGFGAELFTLENIEYFDNPDFEKTFVLESLFKAKEALTGSFIYINSDLIINESILRNLMTLEKNPEVDVAVVVDNSFQYHKHNIDKKLDLVRTNKGSKIDPIRLIADNFSEDAEYIGKNIDSDIAHYEFIGVAYFSEKGTQKLHQIYNQAKTANRALHESSSFGMNSFTDILQELINTGTKVKVLKTYQGWMEIHNQEDLEIAKQIYA